MKKSFYIFLVGLIFYLLISTLFPNPIFVGKVGEFLGNLNFSLFGYLSYLFPFCLFGILYLSYKNKFDAETSLKVLGGVFLFFNFLFFQSLILKKGVIGNLFVNTLKGYIGIIGVSLLIVIFFIWSLFLIFEEKILSSFTKFVNYKKPRFIIKKLKQNNKKDSNSLQVATVIDTDISNIELDPSDLKIENDSKEAKKENIYIQEIKTKEESVNELKIEKENIEEVEKIEEIDNKKALNEEEVENSISEEEFINEKEKKEISYEDNTYNNKKEIKKEEIKEIKEEKIEVKKVEELEDTKNLLSQIEIGKREKPNNWQFPPLDFIKKPPSSKREIDEEEIDKKIKILIEKLQQFKIEGDVVRYYVGPIVTTFEFKPLPHIKVSKILALQDDLAMALKAQSIRIQAPIPGKDVVGIEIPNDKIETIYLREIIESDIFKKAKSSLTIALGKDVVGAPFVTDLKKLPHLLIAGTTGSGKSVGINAMILSLLYRNTPDELKFVMIDPKMLEFSIYNDIPHLLTPVITEPKKAIKVLNAMVKEMERRYKLMSKVKVKNIENYNAKVDEKLPYIVVIIDELADLMMTSGKDVEYSIARLAQMARASGIHLIVATQRPSVDVVTGLIKANLPSRISFKVGQKIDSKVILDQFGAESLLGRGDMLFTPPGSSKLIRLHAPFTTEEEIEKVVEFLKSQREVEYDFVLEDNDEMLEEIDDLDELFEDAKEIILKEKRTSISYLQRRLNIGYNRAANIIEQMERMGILSPPNSKGQREILI